MLFLIAFVKCHAADNAAWPRYVQKSISIPKQAVNVKYQLFKGSYQVVYNANVCFPAKDFIDNTAKAMIDTQWERLIYDPLNPGSKLSYATDKDTKGGGTWWSTYPWKEFWKDGAGNIVYYQFSYDVDGPFPEAVQNACSLKGFVIFYPQEVWALALRNKRK